MLGTANVSFEMFSGQIFIISQVWVDRHWWTWKLWWVCCSKSASEASCQDQMSLTWEFWVPLSGYHHTARPSGTHLQFSSSSFPSEIEGNTIPQCVSSVSLRYIEGVSWSNPEESIAWGENSGYPRKGRHRSIFPPSFPPWSAYSMVYPHSLFEDILHGWVASNLLYHFMTHCESAASVVTHYFALFSSFLIWPFCLTLTALRLYLQIATST